MCSPGNSNIFFFISMGSEENVELDEENTEEKSDNFVDESQPQLSKQHAEMLVKLRREKWTRKTKVTKLKRYLQKLCNVKPVKDGDNTAEIGNCVNELWEILEDTQLVMDELSSLYLQKNDMRMHEGIIQESDNLQGEIQQVIDNAQNMLIAPPVQSKDKLSNTQPALSKGGVTSSNLQAVGQTTMDQNLTPSYQTSSPNTQPLTTTDQTVTLSHPTQSQQPLNPSQQNLTPSYQTSSLNSQLPATTNQTVTLNQPTPIQQPLNPFQQNLSCSYQAPTSPQMQNGNSVINRHLKPLRVPDFDGNKAKF